MWPSGEKLGIDAPLLSDRDGGESVVSTSSSSVAVVNLPVRKLGVFGVVALAFFNVSGGPYGGEGVIAAAGPLWSLLALVLMPWLWSFPVALLTAELSSVFDNDGGYTLWVHHAFGGFMAWNEGYWSWLGGVTDNAVYPALVISYTIQAFNDTALDDFEKYQIWLIQVGMCILLTLFALRGIDVVGWGLSACNILVLLPFVLLVGWAIPRIEPGQWLKGKEVADVDWVAFINIMVWNINGWDACSTFAGEVKNPGRTYPRAMLIAVSVVILCNLIPLAASVGVAKEWEKYDEGYYTEIGRMVGGQWLAVLILLGAAASNACQFLAEMTQDAYQLAGMAESGLVPSFLGHRTKWDTPWVAILTSFVIILVLITRDFQVILELDNTMYCLALLLECAAFVKLRWTHSHLHRPYKVPVPGVWGATLFVFFPVVISMATLWFTSWETKAVCGAAVLLGGVWWLLMEALRWSGWVKFHAPPVSTKPSVDGLKGTEEICAVVKGSDGSASADETSPLAVPVP